MEFVDIALILSYALAIFAAAAAIIFPIISAVNDPKVLKKSAIGIGSIVVVFLIAWSISGNEVTAEYAEFDVDASLSQMIGGSLTMMYLMIGGALLGIMYTEISKGFK